MGYILPIKHDTYTQYANRSVPVKNQYSYIQPAAAIQLTIRSSNHEALQNRQRFAEIVEKKMKTAKSTDYTSSFTGKGKLFNEYV